MQSGIKNRVYSIAYSTSDDASSISQRSIEVRDTPSAIGTCCSVKSCVSCAIAVFGGEILSEDEKINQLCQSRCFKAISDRRKDFALTKYSSQLMTRAVPASLS